MNSFRDWWQHLPEHIDPVIFKIGSFQLQYYGLMYLVAFGICYALVVYRLKREKRFTMTIEQAQGLIMNLVIGLIIGARLGYVLFYNFSYYVAHPLEIISPVQFNGGIQFTGISGMSYHGGLIGVIIAGFLFVRKHKIDFRDAVDLLIPAIPLGYTFGRLGNFINGELYGRATDFVLGMYFPSDPRQLLRHPSQLYEAFFEGLFLFAVLWPLRKKNWPRGAMLGLYLIGYGTVRFLIEFVRQPDEHLGFIVHRISMGQLLCAAMIVSGLIIYGYTRWCDSGTGRHGP